MDIEHFKTICYILLGLGLVVHVFMFYVTIPFGRHTSTRWGPMVNNKLAWVLMEFPSLAIMVYFLNTGSYSRMNFTWILFGLWIIHYFNRTFVYPFRIKATDKKMPVLVMVAAVFFNLINASLNGYYLSELSMHSYGEDWLTSQVTIFGGILFLVGLFINWRADHILINLRKPGEKGYKIPKGFLFNYISSPNHFGEILEWIGFAIMAWNLPAFVFAAWTWANLIPRAKNHHDWYIRQFPDYPKDRKIVLPFIY